MGCSVSSAMRGCHETRQRRRILPPKRLPWDVPRRKPSPSGGSAPPAGYTCHGRPRGGQTRALGCLPWSVPSHACHGTPQGKSPSIWQISLGLFQFACAAGCAGGECSDSPRFSLGRCRGVGRLPRVLPCHLAGAPAARSPEGDGFCPRNVSLGPPRGENRPPRTVSCHLPPATCYLLPATCHQLLAIRWPQSARRRIHQIEMQTSARKTPSCAIVTRVFFRTF